jgi:membrane protein DedA with SNARE-associated domain
MEETLSSLSTWGYAAIAFFSFGGSIVVTAATGVFASLGKIDLLSAIIVAIIFNFMGGNMLFYMGRYQKKDIMPYLKNHTRKIALVHILFRKYGSFAIIIAKFIYGMKLIVPVSMGISKYSMKKFIVINFIASINFVVVIVMLGYYTASTIILIFNYVSQHPWIAPILIITILGSIWFLLHHGTKKR